MSPLICDLQTTMIENGYTLSVAESCTGGKVQSVITSNEGASKYFKGGVVTYWDETKVEVLKVNAAILKEHGAVSELCAIAMAEGLESRFLTTHKIAITGIAGPTGGTLEKPVGTVCFAMKTPKEIVSWTSHFEGGREEVIQKATQQILTRLHGNVSAPRQR